MKVALLSNATTSVLEGMLREKAEVWSPPGHGAWMETALAPPDDLVAFAPELFIILLDRRFAAVEADPAEAVAALRRRFPAAAVVLPDLEAMAAEIGEGFYDERMWKLARMPWSLTGLRELSKLAAPVKKVLALDFDGVLWDGVAGSGEVSPRTDFQREVAALVRRGVVLVALSRNNAADAEAALGTAGAALSRGDFAAWRVDWQPKPENLAAVAAELNLGLDSFVFVDDSPAERAEMRAKLPEVCVPPFPPRLDDLFPPLGAVTAEDAARVAGYRAEAERRRFAAGRSLDDYLESLEIHTDIHLVRADEAARVAQLSQRANQFNVLTNRHSEPEARAFADEAGAFTAVMSAGDRFGELGLIAFVRVRGGEIVDWVMSCRAMNRRLEFALEEFVEAEAARRGVRRLAAAWRRTARNEPVRELYDRFGFRLVSETEEERRYERILG